jgi:hypothetical protein
MSIRAIVHSSEIRLQSDLRQMVEHVAAIPVTQDWLSVTFENASSCRSQYRGPNRTHSRPVLPSVVMFLPVSFEIMHSFEGLPRAGAGSTAEDI